MSFCTKCGKEIISGARFCVGCGAAIEMTVKSTAETTAETEVGTVAVPTAETVVEPTVGTTAGTTVETAAGTAAEKNVSKKKIWTYAIIAVLAVVVLATVVYLIIPGPLSEEEKARKAMGQLSTGASFTDSRNGKTYKTVKIGSQTWMAENLNYQTGSSWCYDNDNSNCEKYGRLYDWNTAMSACPAGWHLPSKDEWEDLKVAVGSFAGNKLKARSGWSDNGNGTDEYGFSALSGGNRNHKTDKFDNIGLVGFWWTTTESSSGAYNMRLEHGSEYLVGYDNLIVNGYSVRCVQGSPVQTEAKKPPTVKTIKLNKRYPSSYDEACTSWYSAKYPQLSGMSNERFQENANKEIENWVKGFLDDGTSTDFRVLQNDGAVFAVRLERMTICENTCSGGNCVVIDDTIMAYDIINSRKTTPRFSKGGNPLYSLSAVTMSAQAINRIISEYENGMLEDCMDEYSISNGRLSAIVVVDGNVAIELSVSWNLSSCVCSACSAGTVTIPLYKWDGIMR